MDFISAVKLAKANEHLLGTKVNGASIDEIIIVPTKEEECKRFLSSYISTLDAQKSVAPFIQSDVEIQVVFDKKRIKTENVFFHTNIRNLPDAILEAKE